MEKKVTLTVNCEKRSYQPKDGSASREYWTVEMDCNGLKLRLKPADAGNLPYQILNNYLDSALNVGVNK